MTIKIRNYNYPEDFQRVGDFLIEHYQPGNRDGNWFQPTWEYMHSHPYLDESALDKIGVWEDSNEIVGVVHYESKLGEVFFEIHPDYVHLKPEMLDYAEQHLYGTNEAGKPYVKAYINDFDTEFEALVQTGDYQREAGKDRPMTQFLISVPFPEIRLPAGFQLKSLQDDNNLRRIHRVLFNKIAYVEPVATDPDYRRRGFGKAAVLEGVRRSGKLGATVAYVGSGLEFYTAIGFTKLYTSNCWLKYLKHHASKNHGW